MGEHDRLRECGEQCASAQPEDGKQQILIHRVSSAVGSIGARVEVARDFPGPDMSTRAALGSSAGAGRRPQRRGRRVPARSLGPQQSNACWTCCSTSSTPHPVVWAIFDSLGSSRCTTTGARPRLISSTMSRRGLPTSARPRTNICCSPPDSRPACRPSRGRVRGSSRARRRRLCGGPDGCATQPQILSDGQGPEQCPTFRNMR